MRHRLTIGASSAIARIAVSGEVDLATSPDLRTILLAVLDGRRPAVLDIDLDGVSFIDCIGMSTLIGVRAAALDLACRMWLRNPQPMVGRVLALTGLLDLFAPPGDPSAPLEPLVAAPGPVPPRSVIGRG